jgi:hypothetical protein
MITDVGQAILPAAGFQPAKFHEASPKPAKRQPDAYLRNLRDPFDGADE